MDTASIKELLAIMDEGDLTALRITEGDTKIELERERAHASLAPSNLPLMAERVGELLNIRDSSNSITAGGDASADESVIAVNSPMVGTFYAAPSPDEEPFVTVGQEVLSGQTLAIVEAMKMMYEITAPAPGIVSEILVANGSQVEFEQPLFRLSASGVANA